MLPAHQQVARRNGRFPPGGGEACEGRAAGIESAVPRFREGPVLKSRIVISLYKLHLYTSSMLLYSAKAKQRQLQKKHQAA